MKEERDVFGDEDGIGRDGEDDVIEAFDEMPATGLSVTDRHKNSAASAGNNADAFAMLPFGECFGDQNGPGTSRESLCRDTWLKGCGSGMGGRGLERKQRQEV